MTLEFIREYLLAAHLAARVHAFSTRDYGEVMRIEDCLHFIDRWHRRR